MAANDYVFVDKFVAPCNKETAYQYISKIEEYPRWWGKVYKRITVLKKVLPDTPGGRYEVQVRGFLPYALTIQNETTLVQKPDRIEFVAIGDLEGKGTWLFEEVKGGTQITFDWQVAANKAVIRLFSFLLKPLFRANHVYCVRRAEEGMRRDLEQRGEVKTVGTSVNVEQW
jgi:hypothetical protein